MRSRTALVLYELRHLTMFDCLIHNDLVVIYIAPLFSRLSGLFCVYEVDYSILNYLSQ
jgi:hypothetical protein